MLTQDQIRSEYEKTVKECYHEEVRDGKPMVERDEALAHLSAQYEKLIGECMPEERGAQWFIDNYFTAENAYPSFNKNEDLWVAIAVKEIHNTAIRTIRTSLQERGFSIK